MTLLKLDLKSAQSFGETQLDRLHPELLLEGLQREVGGCFLRNSRTGFSQTTGSGFQQVRATRQTH